MAQNKMYHKLEHRSTLESIDNTQTNTENASNFLINLISPTSTIIESNNGSELKYFSKKQQSNRTLNKTPNNISSNTLKIADISLEGDYLSSNNVSRVSSSTNSLYDKSQITVQSSRNFNELNQNRNLQASSRIVNRDGNKKTMQTKIQNKIAQFNDSQIIEIAQSRYEQSICQKNNTFLRVPSSNLKAPNAANSKQNKTFTSSRLDASRIINDSRIKLKDYMFMASTSANIASSTRRKILKQTKKNDKTLTNVNQAKSNNQPSQTDLSNSKQRQNKDKYAISNKQMGLVLKQQISKQMQQLKQKMKAIEQSIDSRAQMDSEDLLTLYALRGCLNKTNKQMQINIDKVNGVQDYHQENLQAVMNLFQKQMVRNQSGIVQLMEI